MSPVRTRRRMAARSVPVAVPCAVRRAALLSCASGVEPLTMGFAQLCARNEVVHDWDVTAARACQAHRPLRDRTGPSVDQESHP
jgi:hypothetical protein